MDREALKMSPENWKLRSCSSSLPFFLVELPALPWVPGKWQCKWGSKVGAPGRLQRRVGQQQVEGEIDLDSLAVGRRRPEGS